MDDKNISVRVRRARMAAGLRGKELAEQVGMSQPYLTQIEKGVRVPSDVMLKRLASAMGTTVEWLQAGDNGSAPSVAEVREPPADYGCRIPADCDLPTQFAELRAEMADMRGKLDTLLGLLGGPLRASIGLDKSGDKRHVG